MKLGVKIIGDLAEAMERESRAAARAVTLGVAAGGRGLRDAWRAQIEGAGLGSRLARTIRSEVYPKGRDSTGAAALVWTRAPVIVDAFERGALIRSSAGFFLAIPTPAAGTRGLGGKRITPGGWERRTGMRLRFVYRSGLPSLLVADAARLTTRGRAVVSRSRTGRGFTTVPIFIMLPHVQLRKRLDLARDAEAWAARVPGLIVSNWPD